MIHMNLSDNLSRLTICLFTTTKGHWDIKDRYLETIEGLDNQINLKNFEFGRLIANIKVSPEEKDSGIHKKMVSDLGRFGFKIYERYGSWSHFSETHQNEYGQDIIDNYVNRDIRSEYVLHLEDDFLFCSKEGELSDWFGKCIDLLDNNAHLLQVRIARFANEMDRINGLKQKHGINSSCLFHEKDICIWQAFYGRKI